MKDKEKQIEELIYELKIAMCSYESCEECPTSWCYAEECATMAICKGYRKLPEDSVIISKDRFEALETIEKYHIKSCRKDSVVLSREEYQKLLKDKTITVSIDEQLQKEYAYELKQERKETAEKILNDLYHREELGFETIKWYAKEYWGIEIKE